MTISRPVNRLALSVYITADVCRYVKIYRCAMAKTVNEIGERDGEGEKAKHKYILLLVCEYKNIHRRTNQRDSTILFYFIGLLLDLFHWFVNVCARAKAKIVSSK